MTLQLDERVYQLPGKNPDEQVALGLAIILESPNGEAPLVFDSVSRTAARKLEEWVNPVTGLMQPGYFGDQTAARLMLGRLYFENTDQLKVHSYVVALSEYIQALKAHLKTNPISKTTVIGHADNGLVAVLLECSAEAAEEIMEGSGVLAYGIAQDSTFSEVGDLHDNAIDNLLNRMKIKIASVGRDDKFFNTYCAIKKAHVE